MPAPRQAFAAILAAAALYAAAALFGRWIDAGPAILTAGRFLAGAAALGLWWRLAGFGRVPARDLAAFTVTGAFLAGNGAFFFHAIQVSTVAVAALSLFTYPLQTALLEPLFTRSRWRVSDLLSGAAVLAGVLLLVPRFDWGDASARGAAWGCLAGLCFALRNLLFQEARRRHAPPVQGTVEFLAGFVILLPAAALAGDPLPGTRHALLIVLLGTAFTAVPLGLFTHGLRTFTPSFASLVLSLQPVLSVAYAAALLREVPEGRTLAGAALIVGAVAAAGARRAFARPGLPAATSAPVGPAPRPDPLP